MEGLSQTLIASLLRGPAKKRSTAVKGYALVKSATGELERVALNTLSADEIGGFTGKQGTVKRSRKGRSVIQPNGQRFYAPYGKTEVIAYKA